MVYRRSVQQDYIAIDQLLKSCFGDRSKYGALDDLDNRYLLAFDDDKLIAMTGLCENSPFLSAEIDWTCILREYRGRGIVVNMMREVIRNYSADIYCSCIRFHNNDRINLYYAMKELGFECVGKSHKTFDSRYYNACNDCIYKIEGNCVCCEDLYLRKSSKT